MESLDPLRSVIIRFASSSLPDLPLTIPTSTSTTPILSLKLQIRQYLPPHLSYARLSLIHAGQLLHPTDPLSTLPFPLTTPSTKGKEPAHSHDPFYIHCSLGAPLSPTTLSREPIDALAAKQALQQDNHASTARRAASAAYNALFQVPHQNQHQHQQQQQSPLLGFDRLLTQGWSADDVAELRATFLARLAHSRVPSDMPGGNDEVRALEEQWLDSTGRGGGGGVGVMAGTGVGNDEDDEAAALDDRLWGMLLGFFWPVGVVLGARRPGVWSERRQFAVITGLLVNLVFGVLRVVSGRWESI